MRGVAADVDVESLAGGDGQTTGHPSRATGGATPKTSHGARSTDGRDQDAGHTGRHHEGVLRTGRAEHARRSRSFGPAITRRPRGARDGDEHHREHRRYQPRSAASAMPSESLGHHASAIICQRRGPRQAGTLISVVMDHVQHFGVQSTGHLAVIRTLSVRTRCQVGAASPGRCGPPPSTHALTGSQPPSAVTLLFSALWPALSCAT